MNTYPWLKSERYRLILQCQSKTPVLRRFLSENGWRIAAEKVLRDGKFLYTVMELHYAPDAPALTPAECYFPSALLKNPSQTVAEYYSWVLGGLEIAVHHQSNAQKQQIYEELLALAQSEALSWLKAD